MDSQCISRDLTDGCGGLHMSSDGGLIAPSDGSAVARLDASFLSVAPM
jgi:hypothetical protein